MLRSVPGEVALWCHLYLAFSLPSTLSYGLESSDEGIELPSMHCLVPSCGNWWWCLSRGCEAPGLGYSMEC
jgi:hypothetical protein